MRVALPTLLLLAPLACSEETGRPPVARISASPLYIAQNDGFMTPVSLDGSASADEIDDPMGQRPLGFHWTLSEDYQVQDGNPSSARMTVRLRGDRPVAVTLVVTDADDGLSASATATIGITLPLAPPRPARPRPPARAPRPAAGTARALSSPS